MAYSLLALLTDQTTLTLDALAERIQERFSCDPDLKVLVERGKNDLLLVGWSDWSFQLDYETEPHVAVESSQIAADFAATHPARSQIAACQRRLSLSGGDDPQMDHFNDYLFIVEILESFKGVYLFDPYEGTFVCTQP